MYVARTAAILDQPRASVICGVFKNTYDMYRRALRQLKINELIS